MTRPYTNFGPRSQATPQSEPLAGKDMQRNSAGGYSFALDDLARLQRFLARSLKTHTNSVARFSVLTCDLDLLYL